MKPIIPAMLFVIGLVAGPAWAGAQAEADRAETASPASGTPETFRPKCMMDVEAIQKQIDRADSLLDEAKDSTDRERRQALADRHLKELRAGLRMLRGMPGCAMLQGAEDLSKKQVLQKRVEWLENRLDLMHQLFEQMLARETLRAS